MKRKHGVNPIHVSRKEKLQQYNKTSFIITTNTLRYNYLHIYK